MAWTGSYVGVSIYITVMALVSFVSTYLLSETFQKSLVEEQAIGEAVGGTTAGQRG